MILLVYWLDGKEHKVEVKQPHVRGIQTGNFLNLADFVDAFNDNIVHCHVERIYYTKTAKEVHVKIAYPSNIRNG